MMEYKDQLKLQACLDGELSESEQRQVESWLERDPEVAALAAELRCTTKAFAGFAADIRLPESREFFWSKIQREIGRQGQAGSEAGQRPSWLAVLRRALVPVTGVALVVMAGLVATRHSPSLNSETALDDSGAFTYHDFAAGATLVWLSYPADNELADDPESVLFE
jgi:anti-sigma factor RsiW